MAEKTINLRSKKGVVSNVISKFTKAKEKPVYDGFFEMEFKNEKERQIFHEIFEEPERQIREGKVYSLEEVMAELNEKYNL